MERADTVVRFAIEVAVGRQAELPGRGQPVAAVGMVVAQFADTELARSAAPSSALADSPIPFYLQVADILRGRINGGEWPTGTLIPTLEALAAEFKVARMTARQSVQLLTREGLLAPRRGFGTVVTKSGDMPSANRHGLVRARYANRSLHPLPTRSRPGCSR